MNVYLEAYTECPECKELIMIIDKLTPEQILELRDMADYTADLSLNISCSACGIFMEEPK
jgi:hypothetical protein